MLTTTQEGANPGSVSEFASPQAQQFVGERREIQLTLDDAIAAGEVGMAQATDAAERRDPEFRTKAEAAMLRHLSACSMRQAPGEELVDVAVAHGIVPADERAFGAVFQSLSRRGLIRCVGYVARRKGHGSSGGKLWALCQ